MGVILAVSIPGKLNWLALSLFLCLMLAPRSESIWSSFLSATIHANARKTQWIPNIFCTLGSKPKFEVILGSENGSVIEWPDQGPGTQQLL